VSTRKKKNIIMLAVARETPEILQVLLQSDCMKLLDINAVDTYGKSAFFIACESNKIEALPLLLAAGANVNLADGNGTTPLMSAVTWGRYKCASKLLDSGADLTLRDRQNMTALDYAQQLLKDLQPNYNSPAYCDAEKLVKLLLVASGSNLKHS